MLIDNAIQINMNLNKHTLGDTSDGGKMKIGIKYFRVSDMISYIVN